MSLSSPTIAELHQTVVDALAGIPAESAAPALAALATLATRAQSGESSAERLAHLQRHASRRDDELAALRGVAHALNQADGLQAVLDRAVLAVVDVVEVDAAIIRLVEGEDLVIAAQIGLSDRYISELARLSIADSATGLAVKSGTPQVVDDLTTDPRITRPALTREGFVSSATVPMALGGSTIGVVVALSRHPRRFGADDLELLDSVATEIAIAAENTRLFDLERQRAAALEDVNRLKTDFVLTISHEIRTPLAIVKASLDALHLNWDCTTEDRRRNYVNVGRQGANRLKRLLENLLFVSRIETSAFSPRLDAVDLAALAADSVAGMRVGRPDRAVELTLQPDLPFVRADRAALGEVIVHLLENAIKYSPEGSPVVIGGKASSDGESVDFWVTDHGIGIAPEDMGRLFRRFERIDPTVRSDLGAGLGLYISRELIKSMGGRISAQSKVDLGTTFTVTLPAARVPCPASVPRAGATSS